MLNGIFPLEGSGVTLLMRSSCQITMFDSCLSFLVFKRKFKFFNFVRQIRLKDNPLIAVTKNELAVCSKVDVSGFSPDCGVTKLQ